MGTVDKTNHYFTCPKCATNEIAIILEKGSSWGASWEDPPDLTNFVVKWTKDRFGEPVPMAIECNNCGSDGMHRKS